MFSVFLLIYRNTHESLGELDKNTVRFLFLFLKYSSVSFKCSNQVRIFSISKLIWNPVRYNVYFIMISSKLICTL